MEKNSKVFIPLSDRDTAKVIGIWIDSIVFHKLKWLTHVKSARKKLTSQDA